MAPCCNLLTLQPEQSGGWGSNPTSTFERHDKGSRTRLALSYFCDRSAWRRKPQFTFNCDNVERKYLEMVLNLWLLLKSGTGNISGDSRGMPGTMRNHGEYRGIAGNVGESRGISKNRRESQGIAGNALILLCERVAFITLPLAILVTHLNLN